jgi:hypothetical protein
VDDHPTAVLRVTLASYRPNAARLAIECGDEFVAFAPSHSPDRC